MADHEFHSNPLAPSDDEMEDDDKQQGKLSNADFRKLLMTPRLSSAGASTPALSSSAFAKPKPVDKKDTDANNARKKKKTFYAQLKKEEDERVKELATKYRDRAKERRDRPKNEQPEAAEVSTTANYKAVAPNPAMGNALLEMRKQVIEESKYLGGDMENTHRVKGLDYALLDQAKAEIARQEIKELEAAMQDKIEEEEEDGEENITFRTTLGRNIVRAALPKRGPIERNDLFLPGRMTYVFDLDDPFEELPTTIIRSKADCVGLETAMTLSNNDIVINKLTQILSYLRQGKGKDRKKKDKRDKEKPRDAPQIVHQHVDIFENINPNDGGRHHKNDRTSKKESDVKKSYFEKPSEEENTDNNAKLNAKDLIKNINERYGNKVVHKGEQADDMSPDQQMTQEQKNKFNKLSKSMEIDSYVECYPGMMEMVDTLDDSDDEADYTKMDQGNKKGPVGRWDFETTEEYSSYMSSREALPKAAFQYGVKMADGRKTRRAGPRDEKKELDREWSKIQNIISKRKSDSQDVFGNKKPKH